MTFRDLFSEHANLYALYRPRYPAALFDWLSGMVPRHDLAWDCGTGSGQAAIPLAERFGRVVATDVSSRQLANATPHPRIEYRQAAAESSGIPVRSVDLTTVAQAAHWFALDSFFAEAKRVLSPGGVIAIWGYGDPVLDSAELDGIVARYNRGTIENYWMPERKLILDGYRSIPFPFREIAAPDFTMECDWTLPELSGYMRTWSATVRYAAELGGDPVGAVETELASYWGAPGTRRLVSWPFHLRVGLQGTGDRETGE